MKQNSMPVCAHENRRLLLTGIAVGLLAVSVGCGGGGGGRGNGGGGATTTPVKGDADPARSTMTVDRAAHVIADGQDAATITVTLKDKNGDPVKGAPVTLTVTGTGNTLVQPGPTDGAGVGLFVNVGDEAPEDPLRK